MSEQRQIPRSCSIAILYNLARQWDRVDINSVLDGVTSIQRTLDALGHQPVLLRVSDGIPALVEGLRRAAPDLVFNLCEGYHEKSAGEYFVAGLLELLGIPYTGSGPLALALALEKPVAKRLFAGAGIRTPAFAVYTERAEAPPTLSYPLILKLTSEDASLGITAENVVADERSFDKRLSELLAEHGTPVLAEAFIEGREFTVAMLDGRPIALEEIEFDVAPSILCYKAKWASGSPEDRGTRAVFAPVVTDREREEMFELAGRVWDLLGMRDYGRVDFRMDRSGQLFVLEANPNPDITPNAGYRFSLEAAHIPFDDFVARLIEMALRRGPAGAV